MIFPLREAFGQVSLGPRRFTPTLKTRMFGFFASGPVPPEFAWLRESERDRGDLLLSDTDFEAVRAGNAKYGSWYDKRQYNLDEFESKLGTYVNVTKKFHVNKMLKRAIDTIKDADDVIKAWEAIGLGSSPAVSSIVRRGSSAAEERPFIEEAAPLLVAVAVTIGLILTIDETLVNVVEADLGLREAEKAYDEIKSTRWGYIVHGLKLTAFGLIETLAYMANPEAHPINIWKADYNEI